MADDFIPLISPQPFQAYSPEAFRIYIQGLYVEPVKPPPPLAVKGTVNKKGNLVLTVRRDPKYLLPAEIDQLAFDLGWTRQRMWVEVTKRKITVERPKVSGGKLSGAGKTKSKSSGTSA